jgi:hypothetical protein
MTTFNAELAEHAENVLLQARAILLCGLSELCVDRVEV